MTGEVAAAGTDNILIAYGLGNLKKLPGVGSNQVRFLPSDFIRWSLRPPYQSNYARISYARGSHSLALENTSKSVGHNVYVKVVLFRKYSKEQE